MLTENIHLTTHDGDNKDDSGVAAIVRAFIRNPAGAIQIVLFIGGMYGVYYAIQSEISDVKASNLHRYEQMAAKVDILVETSKDQATKVDAVYTRGDVRYSSIIAKLSAHDVDIAKLVTNSENNGKQLDRVLAYLSASSDRQKGVEPRPPQRLD